MNLTVRLDGESAYEALRDLKDGPARAITRALNRSVSELRTMLKRELAADVGVPVGVADQSIGTVNATFNNLVATLTVTGRRIPLIDLKARQTRAGVTYAIGSMGRTMADGAFIATMRSSHEGVFRRRGQFPALVGRLPIDELKGPSFPHVLGKQWARKGWDDRGQEIFEKNLEHEIDFVLERAGKGGVPA